MASAAAGSIAQPEGAEAPESQALSAYVKSRDTTDVDNGSEEDFSNENYIAPDDAEPSVSPRDKLSYQDDKKIWKEYTKFQASSPQLNKLIYLMQMAIYKNKPDNIVDFLCDEFFSEKGQIQLRAQLSTA